MINTVKDILYSKIMDNDSVNTILKLKDELELNEKINNLNKSVMKRIKLNNNNRLIITLEKHLLIISDRINRKIDILTNDKILELRENCKSCKYKKYNRLCYFHTENIKLFVELVILHKVKGIMINNKLLYEYIKNNNNKLILEHYILKYLEDNNDIKLGKWTSKLFIKKSKISLFKIRNVKNRINWEWIEGDKDKTYLKKIYKLRN